MKIKKVLATAAVISLALVAANCSSDGSASAGSGTGTAEVALGGSATQTTTVDPATETTAVAGTDEELAAAAALLDTTMGSPVTGDTKDLNIAQIAAGTPDLTVLTRLVVTSGLLPTVRDGGPFTVFAPTNEAFGKLPPATVQAVLDDVTLATTILTLHVVPGSLTTEDLKKAAAAGTTLDTANGGKLKVEVDGEDVIVGGAKIVLPDVPASNGTVQVVDSVIAEPNG